MIGLYRTLAAFVILLVDFTHIVTSFIAQEQLLISKLLEAYDPLARPVLNHRHSLSVSVSVTLTQGIEISERDQILMTTLLIEQEWVDLNLVWSPEEFQGIKTLRIPTRLIWIPDTVIFNLDDPNSSKENDNSAAILHFDGLVRYPTLAKLRSSCQIDMTYFPFDNQICFIKLASYTYNMEAVDLNIISYENKTYDKKFSNRKNSNRSLFSTNTVDDTTTNNGGWIILNTSFVRKETFRSNEIYPELIYYFHIKRRYVYYLFNVILPCTMISILACMTFSYEKITLSLTCFVANSFFMLMVAERIPTSADTCPIISWYLSMVMSFTAVSVFLSVIVLNLYEKSKNVKTQYRLPYFVRLIALDHLAVAFGIKHNQKEYFTLVIQDRNFQNTNQTRKENEHALFRNISNEFQRRKKLDDSKHTTSIWRKRSKIQRFEKKELQLKREYKEENAKINVSYEWLFLSLVVDRIIFWLFTITTIVCYMITLFVYPFILQPSKSENYNL